MPSRSATSSASTPGCSKRVVEDCRDKFQIPGSLLFAHGNARNFRGEPFVPGSALAAINPLDD